MSCDIDSAPSAGFEPATHGLGVVERLQQLCISLC